jgi:hypothetical protein
MNQTSCDREAQVIEASRSGLWDEELRRHLSDCRNCAESAVAASFLSRLERIDHQNVDLPGAGQMWWKLQLRARREAIERAARPISYFQSITLLVVVSAFVGICVWQWDQLCSWLSMFVALCRLNSTPFQDYASNIWKSWSMIMVVGAGAVTIFVSLAMWLARPED